MNTIKMALARKWRPRRFSELVGHLPITEAITHALHSNRLHHAYLFTGTRGVGKTSIARLFAKAINCETGVSAEPCLVCNACQSIEQGIFVDLFEMDAASRTGVDDMREILENVPYAPINARFKVYLIDEVHMLSQASFNALLKTLEEPPAHVIFLLATTEPQKLPATVISRCLQFHLRPMSMEVILARMQFILQEESITFELAALNLIAYAARGSMRDALSLLDQAILASSGLLTLQNTKALLGYTQQEYAPLLLQALAAGNLPQLFVWAQQIAEEGGHYPYVLDSVLQALHQIAIYQSLGDVMNGSLIGSMTPELLQLLSRAFSPEEVQLFYQIVLKSKDEFFLAPHPAIAFDMVLLRLHTFKPAGVAFPKVTLPVTQESKPIEHVDNVLISSEISMSQSHDLCVEEKMDDQSLSATHHEITALVDDWPTLLKKLALTGLVQTAAAHAEWVEKVERSIKLRVARSHQALFTSAVIKRLEAAFTAFFKETIHIMFEFVDHVSETPAAQAQAMTEKQQKTVETSLAGDAFFQTLQEEFAAKVVQRSVTSATDPL